MATDDNRSEVQPWKGEKFHPAYSALKKLPPLGGVGGSTTWWCVEFPHSRPPGQWEAVSFVRFVALVFCMDSLVFCMGSKSGFDVAGITLQSRVFFSSFLAGGRPHRISRCLPPYKILMGPYKILALHILQTTAPH